MVMKKQLLPFLTVLALMAGIVSVGAQSKLTITPAGNHAIVSWPAGATNYVLQSATNLTSTWLTLTNASPGTNLPVPYDVPDRFFRLFPNLPLGLGMAPVAGGVFVIGDTLDGEPDALPMAVYVSTFYMDTNLVSYTQWQAVYAYATNHGYGFDHAGADKDTNHPVQTVDWYDVVKWCNARSVQAGLVPIYYTDAAMTHVYTNLDTDLVYANWSASGYRLPTEAEWEKAARGGLVNQRFPWGNIISQSLANYNGDTTYSYDLGPNGNNPTYANGVFPYTSPVASFPANGFGINDMAGNVLEWCWDWYAAPPYPLGSPYLGGADPHGPASSPQNHRVVRGGFWNDGPYYERCADRDNFSAPSGAYITLGFRCVKLP